MSDKFEASGIVAKEMVITWKDIFLPEMLEMLALHILYIFRSLSLTDVFFFL